MLKEEALKKRQRDLLETLPNHVLLLAAGQSRFRNITSSTYAFRPASSFMYFFGDMPPGAIGVLADGKSYLFLEKVSEDDVVWHGPRPTFEDYEVLSGADHVKRKDELLKFLSKFDPKKILSLPTLDPVTNSELRLILDRTARHDGPDSTLVNVIINMRLYQDEFALAEIRKATDVTARAFERGLKILEPGKSESEIRAELEYAATASGCNLAFDPIVTTHGEVLHQPASEGTAEAGDVLLVDFGAESKHGYASDVTRCWAVSGSFTEEQKDIYELVLHVQKTALALAKPGIEFKELHQVACETVCQGLVDLRIMKGEAHDLAKRGAHTLFFPHGLGHLLGLDVHDMEDFGDAAGYAPGRARSEEFGHSALRLDRELLEDMVVTIEPGIYYIPALLEDAKRTAPFDDCIDFEKAKCIKSVRGVRIEDTVLIKEDGCEILSSAIPKELSDIQNVASA